LDINEKKLWEDTSANLFINKFYSSEKAEALNVQEYDFENLFDTNEALFKELFQEIKKISLEDISSLTKIEGFSEILREKLSENLTEIKRKSVFYEKKNENLNEIELYRQYYREKGLISQYNDYSSIYSNSLLQMKFFSFDFRLFIESNITEFLFTLKISIENLQPLIGNYSSFNDFYLFTVLKQIIEKIPFEHKNEVNLLIFFPLLNQKRKSQ